MPEYRHIRSGSLSIPTGSHNSSHSMPRSPPNTSHVPCKFYRQGTCQAGNACPFSHDLGAAAENICKYFAKGNCKFGPKCANIHVLPDGRRINYGKNGVTIGPTPINLASRSATSHGSTNSTTASALTSSLYRTDQSAYPYDENNHHLGRQPSLDNGLPTIDTPYSHPNSNYGSPREEDSTRLGFGLSPANGGKGLSVLDAPLPASFDSNGISNAARYPAAPWPSSVPSKFGLESPSPSLSSIKDSRTSETLKLLHTSAFGSSEHLATPTAGSPLARIISMATIDRDWDPEFAFDDDNVPENLVPGDLQELLTPLEKARRGSMRAEQPDISIDGMTKYGSPIGTSPSRWGPLFQRQKEEEEMSRAARSAAGSVFGHVGSPLRNSILAQEANGEFRGSNGLHRPSTVRTGSDAMSALSQQLQRSRLDDTFGNSSPLLHPTTNRTSSNGIGPIGKDRAMERHVSSGSISSSVTGRFTTPIDEEDPAFVFSMEEEDDSSVSRIRKRASAGLTLGDSAMPEPWLAKA
ncbi:Protein cps3 [Cladobotryum mycophilum]|uniref:Protein cps3 n=1 Tax=Cladobotryum mycophilum TaxID=491253 RepID=A0ABR0SLP7_9HYPO